MNLFSIVLDPFKGKGHSVVCDSTHMSEIMANIARVIWVINLIGTCPCNRIGADTDCLKDGVVEVGSCDSVAWQRKDGKLSFCVWGDDNLVKPTCI